MKKLKTMKTSNNQYSLKFLGATVRKSRTFLKPAISLLCGVFLSQMAYGQNLILHDNSKFINVGKVIMKADTGKFKSNIAPANYSTDFVNKAGGIVLAGTNNKFTDTAGVDTAVTAPGSSYTARIPGRVIYNDTNTTEQNVHGNRWYDSLELASSAPIKLDNNVYVGGTGKAFIIGTGTVGTRTYATSSTIIYDGTTSQTLLEDETYNNLRLSKGASSTDKKTLPDGKSITVAGTFQNDSTNKATFEIFGTLNVQKYSNFDTLSGPVTVGDGTNAAIMNFAYNSAAAVGDTVSGGTWTIAKSSKVILGTSTAATGNTTKFNTNVDITAEGNLTVTKSNMTIASGKTFALPANANSVVNFKVDTLNTVLVNGSLTSADTEGDNVQFNSNSVFEYNSNTAQTILATSNGNPYGDLYLKGSGVKKSARNSVDEDLFVKGDSIYFQGGNLDMLASGDKALILNNSLSRPIGIAYATDSVEVVGKMTYQSASFIQDTNYTLNNAKTFVRFTQIPGPGMTFTMSSVPNDTSKKNYDPKRDVKRHTNITYDQQGWIATLQVGYKKSETGLPTAQGGGNTWTSGFDETMIRMYESSTSVQDSIEKLGGSGFTYTRDSALITPSATLGSIKLTGIEPQSAPGTLDGTTDRFFLSGQDLVLRSGPAVITSVSKGRWSNPFTWDENAEPKPMDEVMIKHTVHAGYVRATDSYATAEATPDSLASKITIAQSTLDNPTPSLLLGGNFNYGISDVDRPGITNEGSLTIAGVGTETTTLFDYANNKLEDSQKDVLNNTFNAGLTIYSNAALWVKENLYNKGGIQQIGGSLIIGK